MTNIIRIPANAQALLSLVHDGIHDKHDVVELEYNYGCVEAVEFPAAWGYWKMEETGDYADRLDSTGNGHTLYVASTWSKSEYDVGKLGNAIKLIYEYGKLNTNIYTDGYSDGYFPEGITTQIMSFWVYFHFYGGTEYESDTIEVYAEAKMYFQWNETCTKFQVLFEGMNGSILTDFLFDADTWYHIYAERNTSGMNLYVNNILIDSWSGEEVLYGDDSLSILGCIAWHTGSYQLVDEVGMWFTPLTADQRTQLYNSGAGWSPY